MTDHEPTTVADELAAMRRIVATLDKLDPTARTRVIGWLTDRYPNARGEADHGAS